MASEPGAVKLTANRVFGAKAALQALDLLSEYEPSLRSFPDPVMRFRHRLITDNENGSVGLDIVLMVDKQKKLDFEFTISRSEVVVRATIAATVTIAHRTTTYLGNASDMGDGKVHTEIDPPVS